jgi:hypothetical protein
MERLLATTKMSYAEKLHVLFSTMTRKFSKDSGKKGIFILRKIRVLCLHRATLLSALGIHLELADFKRDFRATNPGIWPIHCHQGVHLDGGMSALIEIKDDVHNRPFSYLPSNFPRCGNFEPETDSETFGRSSAVLRIFSSLMFLVLKLF